MTRPIVHIGYHKTASTWFQRAYYPNARNYRFVDRRTTKRALLGESALPSVGVERPPSQPCGVWQRRQRSPEPS